MSEPKPSTDYADWLRQNPAPDLQELVRQFGSYTQIPDTAWKKYDSDMANWKRRFRNRAVGAKAAT